MTPAWKTLALAAAPVLALLAACAGGGPALAPPPPQTFAQGEIEQGAGLAKIGGCEGCHTTERGAFAGGRPIKTPFGVVYTANISPDPKTGLGRYTREAFIRAMHRGVRVDGAQLYPAFPYDHFAYADDHDLAALYAFLMTRRPVESTPPPPKLIPPVGFRPIIGIWKALFFHPGRFTPAADQSPEWNRGAYLAKSLGHCGACHTPHNALGAEQTRRELDGNVQEGWYAPPLNELSPAATPWTPEALYRYLRTGIDLDHQAAAGPMGGVTRELAHAPEADVRALSVYLASLMRPSPAGQGRNPPADRAQAAAAEHPEGATLFAGACAACHEPGSAMMREGRPPLQFGSPLQEDNPRDLIAIVLTGLQPPVSPRGPYMPAFRDSFTDAQLAEITAYVRARYSDKPPWRDLPREVAKARKETAS